MSLRHAHAILLAAMLLLVGLLSVGPLCAEVVCSSDECAREIAVFRGSSTELPSPKATARAIGSGWPSALAARLGPLLSWAPAALVASPMTDGGPIPLRM